MQNRVIKFRAWIPEKEFIENVIQDAYMAIQGTADLETLQSFMHHYGNEPLLMQFTGLTDKNGVEIYEGDVIKFHYFYGTLGDGMGFVESEASLVGVVNFDEFGITVTDIKCKHWQELTGYEEREGESYIYQLYAMNESSVHEESFEVIGNIYENPELLNP